MRVTAEKGIEWFRNWRRAESGFGYVAPQLSLQMDQNVLTIK